MAIQAIRKQLQNTETYSKPQENWRLQSSWNKCSLFLLSYQAETAYEGYRRFGPKTLAAVASWDHD